MLTSTRTDYKIIVEEYKNQILFNLTLLSRDQKEPVEFIKNLGYVEIEQGIEHLIEKFNINDNSKIFDIVYDSKGKIIHKEEMTVKEYKEV